MSYLVILLHSNYRLGDAIRLRRIDRLACLLDLLEHGVEGKLVLCSYICGLLF